MSIHSINYSRSLLVVFQSFVLALTLASSSSWAASDKVKFSFSDQNTVMTLIKTSNDSDTDELDHLACTSSTIFKRFSNPLFNLCNKYLPTLNAASLYHPRAPPHSSVY